MCGLHLGPHIFLTIIATPGFNAETVQETQTRQTHRLVHRLFQTEHGKAIMFEVLGFSRGDYLDKTSFAPMLLSDCHPAGMNSTPSDGKQSTDHSVSFRLWYILTGLELSDGYSI